MERTTHLLWNTFLLQCMDLGVVRKKFFETNSLSALLKNTHVEDIFPFLTEKNVFRKFLIDRLFVVVGQICVFFMIVHLNFW